jgi:hypothetical protein
LASQRPADRWALVGFWKWQIELGRTFWFQRGWRKNSHPLFLGDRRSLRPFADFTPSNVKLLVAQTIQWFIDEKSET